MNPLEMEAIVEVVINYVDPKDLPNCRLVSKLWKNEARTHFGKRVTFHISDTRWSEIQTFLDHASESFPKFRNLKLDLDLRSWQGNEKNVTQLLTTYGPTLHKLQLKFGTDGCKQLRGHELRDIFLDALVDIRELELRMSCQFMSSQQKDEVNRILPNLTTLRLDSTGTKCGFPAPPLHMNLIWMSGVPSRCPGHTDFYTDLLRLVPNLETLHWGTEGDSRNFIQDLLQVNPSKLTHLFVHSNLDMTLMDAIANSQLSLKQLYLETVKIGSSDFGVHLVSGLNGTCKVTLKQSVYPLQTLDDIIAADDMQIHLENVLSQCGDVCCAQKLQNFMSAIDRGLNQ